MNRMIQAGLLSWLLPVMMTAQPVWKPAAPPPQAVELFHSVQLANLPTTESLKKGDFFYEISHRFGAVTSGFDGFFGLDGPVNMRTALAYGLSDRWMITLGRSNIQDNVDVKIKVKLRDWPGGALPFSLSLQAGAALNSEVYGPDGRRRVWDSRNMQYFGQVILNTMLWDGRLGLGMAPSLVYNSYIFAGSTGRPTQYTLALPFYAQYYFNRMWSLFLETGTVAGGWRGGVTLVQGNRYRSPASLGAGVAIETGGHVFYLFVTNNRRLNASQYLLGADAPLNGEGLVLAFSITRVL